MEDLTKLFWSASIDEMKQGYVYSEQDEEYACLICGERFVKGMIYSEDNRFYEAERFARLHIESEHASTFEYLLDLDKKMTGISDLQKPIVQMFYQGLSDKEIMKELGSDSTSIVRNHRFALREKVKQAKVFLAIMEQVEEKASKPQTFIHTHRTPAMADMRYAITEAENEQLLSTYFPNGLNGELSRFPKKQKHKIAILTHIMKRFKANRTYTEKEVNEILQNVFGDYVTIRRYLIDYGFMERKPDGTAYWVKIK